MKMHEAMAAGHRAMATGHRTLAETLERWPELARITVESAVRTRGMGTTCLVRAELRLKEAPLVSLLDSPIRCPWAPELLEATLATGVIALWPAAAPDLGKALVHQARAYAALGAARRESEDEGEVSDRTLDRLVDAAQGMAPCRLLELVRAVALEGVRPAGLSLATLQALQTELGGRRAA